MRILTTGRLGKEFRDTVNVEYNRNEIFVEYIQEVDQHVLNKFKHMACFHISADLDISHISYIHSFGAGVNTFIDHPALSPDVKISRTVGQLGRKIAEYCLAYMLEDHLEITSNFIKQKKRVWEQGNIRDIFKSSVAVLGTGEMGSKVAELLSLNGCIVYGINTDGKHLNSFKECFSVSEFCTAPPDIDTLISVIPSTTHTRGLLDKDFFRNLAGVHLISVGRGDVLNEKEIDSLIKSGKCRKITLDVFEHEPLPSESDLWLNEQVIITPHLSAITDIKDIMTSFNIAYEAYKNQIDSPLFVNLQKGY